MSTDLSHWGEELGIPRDAFLLEPDTTHLNHGSFGAATRAVLEEQFELRKRMEQNTMRFFTRELPTLLGAARETAAAFVGAGTAGFAFVPNATFAVNSVLRSLQQTKQILPGDDLLTTNHSYNACRNVLDSVAAGGARVVVAQVPFPLRSAADVTASILERVTPRTKFALIDHVTSQTALIFPIHEVVAELRARGIETLVDGAHAPGMLPLDLEDIGAAYYTGNFHKWVCAPKGAAFLWVRADRIATTHPAIISHGANADASAYSRFHLEFDWTGTVDPTAVLCVPRAIVELDSLWPGGLSALRVRNHGLALRMRHALARQLGTTHRLTPDDLLGWMAAIELPDTPAADLAPLATSVLHPAGLQRRLSERYRVEVPVFPFPTSPKRLLRVSAHAHTSWSDADRLLTALGAEGIRLASPSES